jgi:hypothetical protein
MVLQSEDFTQLLELCSLHNVPQQAHGKYGDNEEGKLNRLTLPLLIGWLVPTIKQPLLLAKGRRPTHQVLE